MTRTMPMSKRTNTLVMPATAAAAAAAALLLCVGMIEAQSGVQCAEPGKDVACANCDFTNDKDK